MPTTLEYVDLPQARHEGDVFDLAVLAYQNEIPGFQDTRLADLHPSKHLYHLNGVLDEIEAASLVATGETVPFSYYPPLWNESGEFAPHIDGTFRGLSVHKNRREGGTVNLAHPAENPHQGDKPIVYTKEGESYNRYKGIGMAGLADIIKDARVFRGDLTEHGITVFSQGNFRDLLPTIHYFDRSFGTSYARIASSLKDADKSPEELALAVRSFRGALAMGEFHDLKTYHRHQYYDDEPGPAVEDKDLFDHPGLYIKGSQLRGEQLEQMGLIERIKARRDLRAELKRLADIRAEREQKSAQSDN